HDHIRSATRFGKTCARRRYGMLCAERFEKGRRALRQSASNKPGTRDVDETSQSMAASPPHKRVGPMKRFALIAVPVLVPLVLAAPSVQAQTSPTNATANSQLANSNTANALGITTGVTTGVTTGTPTTGQQQTSTSNRNPTTGVMCIQEIT